MRILWLSIDKGLYKENNIAKSYNGGGWISSLQRILEKEDRYTLAMAFTYPKLVDKVMQGNTLYYPIYSPQRNTFVKLKNYYGGYKKINYHQYVKDIQQIIIDFKPDIIHLWGIEIPLSNILGNTAIPIVVHLQGLLAPYDNAFFPTDFNKSSFLFPFSINEWVFRNGYIFAKNNIHIQGQKEIELFKKVNYVMGRTQWDYQVSQFLAPQSKYFLVNEVLREPFYDNAGKWNCPNKEITIVSTISNTTYKGLDVILKTAQLLKKETNIPFKWQIIGVRRQHKIVRFFEHKLRINSKDVNIEYRGILNAEELCNTLLRSHLYVHPSYIDNSPNSVCEAQLLGVPVIGTYVGGIPSLIKHEETGLLVPANAPYELAYQIKRCITDKALCKLISKNSKAVALYRHNKENILKALLESYHAITKIQGK